MSLEERLPVSLFLMRVSVFVVMLLWTIDKFYDPDHAALVFRVFYYFPPVPHGVIYAIGAAQLLIILGFLLGVFKTFTYGVVFLMHAVSTLSTFKQYMVPYEETNLLFFTAWPMLAACFVLMYLRRWDVLMVAGRKAGG